MWAVETGGASYFSECEHLLGGAHICLWNSPLGVQEAEMRNQEGFLKVFPCFQEEGITLAINISDWGRNQVEREEIEKELFPGAV